MITTLIHSRMKKLNTISIIFLSVVVLLLGCTRPEETGTIYGTVTDYITGEPIKNANVKLRPSGETTLTGSDGTYQFQNLKPGDYSLSLSKVEYDDVDEDYVIKLVAGGSVRRDVQMKQKIAALRITDMNGNDLSVLNFGTDFSVISKSFNIINEGTASISCSFSYYCSWIASIIVQNESVESGQTVTIASERTVPIIVTINRSNLVGGENTTIFHVTSGHGSNELTIRAIGIGGPVVTTANVNSVTATSAVCGGNVSDNGGGIVTERGVCWSLSPMPSLENGNHKSMGSGMGSFSNTITELFPNTPYYIRAYATNESGTAYGEEKMFTTEDGLPTVTTTTASNITATTATSGGNVTGNGGFPVTIRGVCWNTGGYPDINDPHTTNGTGNGSFTANITGLGPGTTYHVRAYATNSMGTSYGQDKQFTTNNGTPTVTTTTVTNITATTAQSGGNATGSGGLQITAKGICWNTGGSPDVNDQHTTNGSGNGSFIANMTGLTPSTTYHVRAYATTSAGTTYGPDKTFTTKDGKPEVTTTEPTKTGLTVTTGGNVTSDGGFPPVTARGICWGTAPNPDLSSAHHHTTNGSGIGSYTSTFEMPSQGVYYIRAYATNANGTSYGEQKQINHPYNDLPTFTYGGQTYRVAPAAATTMNWSNANSYCNNLTLYGYSDWRMPTGAELATAFYQLGGVLASPSWTSNQCNDGSAYPNWGHVTYSFSYGSGYDCHVDSETLYVTPIRVEQ